MPSANADQPTILDALDVLIRHVMKTISGVRVGTVKVYDPVQRVADVQPVRRRKARGAVFDLPLVAQAPVGWWRFGQMVLAGQLEPGDTVLLVTCEREVRPWWIGGLDHDPDSPRTHDPTDTIVLPWISALTKPITARAAGSFFIGREDGTAGITIPMASVPPSPAGLPGQIIIDGILAGIKLGSGAVQPALLGTTTISAINAYATAQTSAAGVLAGAFNTWAGVFPSTAISNGALSGAVGTWSLAQASAAATLGVTLATAVATKVLVE